MSQILHGYSGSSHPSTFAASSVRDAEAKGMTGGTMAEEVQSAQTGLPVKTMQRAERMMGIVNDPNATPLAKTSPHVVPASFTEQTSGCSVGSS